MAVLASGGGTNLQAIIDHVAAEPDRASGSVVLVASNRTDAGALARARAAGIATHVIADVNDAGQLLALLQQHTVDLLVLSGYLKLIPAPVVSAFANRLLNVHPSLLPMFGGHGMYGLRVHSAVLEAGVRVTGVTVHIVDEHFDRGAIIAQWPVPVLADDTAESLARRVLRVEHWLYPRVIQAVAAHIISGDNDGRELRTLAWPMYQADAPVHFSLRDASNSAPFALDPFPR